MKAILTLAITIALSTSLFAQTQSFTVNRTVEVPIDSVWTIVGVNYADIAKSHPKLTASHYIKGTPMSGEGCERLCSFSSNGKKYTKERMTEYNEEEYSFKAEILAVNGLPIDTTQSYMLYNLDAVNDSTTSISLTMVYRTNPAFLGKLAKGKFKRGIEDYALSIQHYALTGEEVNPDNFKQIKKLY
ncbi:SRPBCC family protein [Flammeovirga kamogawensis]|uniref:SRPBCC family protein n=1 Tax=Flammeovirga kamogawensis TaxID=373891 RepID=A0ABX8H238_9BACT|nr:SRPBCC family protein [Flammeovirga kamogawensis]MBB6463749.1 hypothetical protein [Flammeovirga kamogawensis]QWG09739.1 SRPBCC family protein [Flammeovirga kamogawensis]TRX65252.1 hypothetical protein EO216_22270 [Flammeovirga kamogawensis]